MVYAKDIMDTDYAACQEKDSLAKAMAKMDSESESDVLVFCDKEFSGIFQPGFVTRINMQINETEVSHFTKRVKMMGMEATEEEMMGEFIESGANILPVEEDGKIAGIVRALDLLALKKEMKGLKVKLAANVSKTMREDEGIGKAIQELFDQKTKALILTDEEGEPARTLSHYDVLRNIHFFSRARDHGGKNSGAFRKEKDDYNAIPAFEFTRYRDQPTIKEEDDATTALAMMKDAGTLTLLVQGTGKALSIRDLLRQAGTEIEDDAPQVNIVGLGDLDIDQMTKDAIKQATMKTALKIAQITGHKISLRVHVKSYKDAQKDKHHKFSVSAHLNFPGEALVVDKAADWDAKTAVQIAMEDIENRVANQYRAPKRGTARHR